MNRSDFGWSHIARLGLVQACLGAIVVLTTSTLNRVMVVELALPALLPGLLVAFHYLVQLARPRMGHGSDVGGRRTPWIIGGMTVLACGGVLAALATVWMGSDRRSGIVLAVFAFALIGLGVSASGTNLLVLLAKRVPAPRRAAAATVVWLMMILGFAVTGPRASPVSVYLICLGFVVVMAWLARNLTRGTLGHKWMAIRDMDIAAEIIGVNPLIAKLSAFAVSSFFVGVAGALTFGVYLGAAEAGEAFGINKSFLVLFMVIIGGLGSILGSFLGAAFLVVLPVLLKLLLVDGLGWPADLARHLEVMIIGALIVIVLIAEPHGMAALWRTIKEKLRLWPFPH